MATQRFLEFSSDPWGNDPIWLAHIFQMGWNSTTNYIDEGCGVPRAWLFLPNHFLPGVPGLRNQPHRWETYDGFAWCFMAFLFHENDMKIAFIDITYSYLRILITANIWKWQVNNYVSISMRVQVGYLSLKERLRSLLPFSNPRRKICCDMRGRQQQQKSLKNANQNCRWFEVCQSYVDLKVLLFEGMFVFVFPFLGVDVEVRTVALTFFVGKTPICCVKKSEVTKVVEAQLGCPRKLVNG